MVIMGMYLALAGRLLANGPYFVSEDLQFTISDSVCRMEGSYHFENQTQQTTRTRLFYPFYLDEDSPFPQSYEVRVGEDKDLIPVFTHPAGISFVLELAPGSQQQVWVSYAQTAHNRQFTYILRSTQAWKRPLEQAIYEIRIPRELSLISCSSEIDTTIQQADFLMHRIVRENFLPSRDLQIKWGNQP